MILWEVSHDESQWVIMSQSESRMSLTSHNGSKCFKTIQSEIERVRECYRVLFDKRDRSHLSQRVTSHFANSERMRWVIVTHTESWWVIMSHNESEWVMMSHAESWWVAMSHTESYWVMVSYDESEWVKVSQSESWWVMMSHIES